MKKISCTLLLLLALTTVQSQNLNEEKKERARISVSKIKSVTQTAYNYSFDLKTKTRKPGAQGIKVGTLVYNQKGQLVEEINYSKFGNQESKTIYKYDNDNHQIETSVYGSDGKLQSKMITLYKADTLQGFNYFNTDGIQIGSSYVENEYETSGNDKIHKIFVYFGKDSTLAGSQKLIYDKAGNLIEFSEYEGRYLKYRDIYVYDKSGKQIEHKFYDKNNEFTGSHKFKYNTSGCLIETQNCGTLAIPYETTVYKNDVKGNFIEAIIYNDNDLEKPKALYKYSYQYFP